MESQGYNRFAQPYKNPVPQDETMNLPFPPRRSFSKQTHHNFGSTPTIRLNPAGSSYNPTWWENKDFPSTKKQQSKMVLGNGKDAKKMTSFKVVHKNKGIASHHFEANPTELNQKLVTAGVNASGTNPQLENLEADGTKKRIKRLTNKEPAKKSIRKWKQEREELQKTIDNLRVKNSALQKKLLRLSEESLELASENNSLLEELVEKYGQEQVADFMKPT